MGYHDRCFDDIPNLKSKDPHHNNKRDKLTESAIKDTLKQIQNIKKFLINITDQIRNYQEHLPKKKQLINPFPKKQKYQLQ